MNSEPLPRGTNVWVCEPQSVATEARCTGAVGSLMSKIRTPSHAPGTAALATFVLLQLGLDWGVSTEENTRSPQTEMSPWLPLHGKKVTCVGLAGFEMSMIRNPLKAPAKAKSSWNARSDCVAVPTLGTLASRAMLALWVSALWVARAGRAPATTRPTIAVAKTGRVHRRPMPPSSR